MLRKAIRRLIRWAEPPAPVKQEPVPPKSRKMGIQISHTALATMARADDTLEHAQDRTFSIPKPMPGVVPEGLTGKLAMDASADQLVNVGSISEVFAEGLSFMGYPYLSELTQRSEYRRPAETIAKDMTRKWIKLKVKGDDEPKQGEPGEGDDPKPSGPPGVPQPVGQQADPAEQKADDKAEKLSKIEALLKEWDVQAMFKKAAESDGFFGIGHLYIDTGDTDDRDELKLPLIFSAAKIKKNGIKGLRLIEPIWTYPNFYNSNDPLHPHFFKPQSWFVMGKEVHTSRLLTFVSRPVPDLLKPAYSFGGLSLSQMMKPYVDNWLRTRQSVSDLVHSFSVFVLKTNLGDSLNMGSGADINNRAQLLNNTRDNRGLFVVDMESEEFDNVSAPLGTLDALQAQSQEQQSAVTGIPLVILLGITPKGLNASSEGEIRVYYQWIESLQNADWFRPNVTRVIELAQLHLYGEVDPDIGFDFEPLWTLSSTEEATVRKTDAETGKILIDAGVIDPEEERKRIANDATTPYDGLDLSKEIVPPAQEMAEAGMMGGGPGGGGPGGAPGAGGPPQAGGMGPPKRPAPNLAVVGKDAAVSLSKEFDSLLAGDASPWLDEPRKGKGEGGGQWTSSGTGSAPPQKAARAASLKAETASKHASDTDSHREAASLHGAAWRANQSAANAAPEGNHGAKGYHQQRSQEHLDKAREHDEKARESEQAGISARLRQQKENEEELRLDTNYKRLMGAKEGEHEGLVSLMSPKEVNSHLDRLNAAPGDNKGARAALESAMAGAQPNLKNLFKRIAEPDGGFTYDAQTDSEPHSGFALSVHPDRSFAKPVDKLKPVDIMRFARKNRDLIGQEGQYIGAWHDPATHMVYLDVSTVADDEEEAHRLCEQYDQISYFDLANGHSVTVNQNATSGGAAHAA